MFVCEEPVCVCVSVCVCVCYSVYSIPLNRPSYQHIATLTVQHINKITVVNLRCT